MRHLLTMGMMMFLTHAGSRNKFDQDLEADMLLENVNRMLGEDYPAPACMDTVFYLLSRMDPTELGRVPAKMVEALLKSRVLEKHRFDGEYLVAIDGTEVYRSRIPHCEKCLVFRHCDGSVDYVHTVLEAKLVTPEGLTFSLGTEFVENEGEDYSKQDCELRALKRLAPRLKARFPRLTICLLMDSLYANEGVLKMCDDYLWSYFITFKEGSIPTLYKEAFEVMERHPENTVAALNSDGEEEIYRWACNLDYKSQTVHLVTADVPKTKRNGKKNSDGKKRTRFVYLTDHRPSADNVITYVNEGGRQRNKIEEAFNVQKNGGMNLEHNYGAQGNAYKNSYHLLQIAHTLMELMTHSDMMGKLIRKKYEQPNHSPPAGKIRLLVEAFKTVLTACKTVRNFTDRLSESLRASPIDDFAVRGTYASTIRLKLIFDTS